MDTLSTIKGTLSLLYITISSVTVFHFQVPEISNSAVELNGVLLNHALVTFRELLLKCAQHYSW